MQVQTEYDDAAIMIDGELTEINGSARNADSLYIFGVQNMPVDEIFDMTILLRREENGKLMIKEKLKLDDVFCTLESLTLNQISDAKYFAGYGLDLSQAMNYAFMYTASVKDISLSACSCDSDKLKNLWAGMYDKNSFTLYDCDAIFGDIETMRSKSRSEPKLASLRFTDCGNLTGDIGVIAQYENLETLVLTGCEGLYGDIGQLSGLKKLQSVTIYTCPGITGTLELSNGTVVEVQGSAAADPE